MTLLRDFYSQTHTHAAMLFSSFGCIYQPTFPCPTLSGQSPKDITGSGITNCLTHTSYSISSCMTDYVDNGGLSQY